MSTCRQTAKCRFGTSTSAAASASANRLAPATSFRATGSPTTPASATRCSPTIGTRSASSSPVKSKRRKGMQIGIYKITHLPTGRIYVGSTIRMSARWLEHKRDLRNGEHGNHALQKAWIKDSAESFEFQVLERVEEVEQLEAREDFYIVALKAADPQFGFNVVPFATTHRGAKRQRPVSAETRAKLSAALRGYKRTAEERQKATARQRGKSPSEETRRKQSAAIKGRPNPKVSAKLMGRPVSEETRARLSFALRASWVRRKAATQAMREV
ncbi:MAG: hypothetical protein GC190_21880 [Alphaproteobacteria bacterium]|nr:hypothetical protein [Alphaproteobacteria bacterium]